VFVFESIFIEPTSCVAAARVWQELQKNSSDLTHYYCGSY